MANIISKNFEYYTNSLKWSWKYVNYINSDSSGEKLLVFDHEILTWKYLSGCN